MADVSDVRANLSGAWDHAHPGCIRGLVTMRIWRSTFPVLAIALRTSVALFPFVLARLAIPSARLHRARLVVPSQHTFRTADAEHGTTLTLAAFVAW